MKKFLCSLILLFYFSALAFAGDFIYDYSTMQFKKIGDNSSKANTFEEGIPEWSNFAPAEYTNPVILSSDEINIEAQELANIKTKVFYCKSDKLYAKIIRGITILPAADCWCANKIAKSNYKTMLELENKNNAYWLERKKQFLNELSACENLSKDAKGMCYLKVSEIEYQKNDNLRLQGLQGQMVQLQKMQNYNLQDINSQLRQINNTLKY